MRVSMLQSRLRVLIRFSVRRSPSQLGANSGIFIAGLKIETIKSAAMSLVTENLGCKYKSNNISYLKPEKCMAIQSNFMATRLFVVLSPCPFVLGNLGFRASRCPFPRFYMLHTIYVLSMS